MVGFEGDNLRPLPVGMVKEVALDGEITTVPVVHLTVTGSPYTDILTTVPDVIRDILKIASRDGVVS